MFLRSQKLGYHTLKVNLLAYKLLLMHFYCTDEDVLNEKIYINY